MTKSIEFQNYVLANYSKIIKCIKHIIKDKNILEFIETNIKKQPNSRYYIESNYLYILNDKNIGFSIKILPSIDEPNNIEIMKKISDTHIQIFKIEKKESNIIVSMNIKKGENNSFYNKSEISYFKDGILFLKSKHEEYIDYNSKCKENYQIDIIFDEYGNYVSKKNIKIDNQNISYENNNYYKGNIPKPITYNEQKNIYTNFDNLIINSKEASKEEYLIMEEKLANNQQKIKGKIR